MVDAAPWIPATVAWRRIGTRLEGGPTRAKSTRSAIKVRSSWARQETKWTASNAPTIGLCLHGDG
jgi:hypothetical protein